MANNVQIDPAQRAKEISNMKRDIYLYLLNGGNLTTTKAFYLFGTHKLTTIVSKLRREMAENPFLSEKKIDDRVIDNYGNKEYFMVNID